MNFHEPAGAVALGIEKEMLPLRPRSHTPARVFPKMIGCWSIQPAPAAPTVTAARGEPNRLAETAGAAGLALVLNVHSWKVVSGRPRQHGGKVSSARPGKASIVLALISASHHRQVRFRIKKSLPFFTWRW